MGLVFSNAGGPGMFGADSDDSDSDDEYVFAPPRSDGARSASGAGGSMEASDAGVGGVRKRFEYDSPKSRLLFRHLRKSNFAGAMELINSAAASDSTFKLARATDAGGRTPLHVAVRNYRRDPPPQLVHRLLAIYPGATRVADGEGNTVLHYACDACSNQVLFRTILESHPRAALVSNARGELPLHMADSKFATTELARRYPETVTVADESGKTPLFLFADLLVRHITVLQGSELRSDFGPDSIDAGVVFHKQCPPYSAIALPDVWDSVETMVRASCAFSVPLLHASVRYGLCPTVYIGMVCRMKPEQARRRDVWGDLPLHAAARDLMARGGAAQDGAVGRKRGDAKAGDAAVADRGPESDSDVDEDTEAMLGENMDKEVPGIVQSQSRGWEVRRRTDDVHRIRSARRGHRRGTDLAEDAVREILSAYPQAARERDVAGRLPLQCASAGGGMTWGGGARLMLASYPGALHVGGWARRRPRSAGATAARVTETECSQVGKKRKRTASGSGAPALQNPLASSRNLDRQKQNGDCGNSDTNKDRLDERLLPRVLSKVGRDCALGTMFELLSGRPDLISGGVALRRSGRKRRKRS